MAEETINPNRSQVNTVLIGILIVLAGFWLYKNFTKTEVPMSEEVEIEQGTTDQVRDEGVVAGDQIGPGIGGGSAEVTGWEARDISQNSIKDGNYTVLEGDTLWEIAEGRYGSGFEWHKILEANKDKIGFLPDGSQALIQIGQVLFLPD